MISLIPSRNFQSSPQYYFQDVDYTDYRELVCFERPACFILHYYFGIKVLRSWLFDRFAFEYSNGQFVHQSNALANMLQSRGCVECLRYQKNSSFTDVLKTHLGPQTALIFPSETWFGESVSITSIIIEGYDHSDGMVLQSCLRGDDFYLRSKRPFLDLASRLSADSDGLVEFHRVSVTQDILNLGVLTHNQVWEQEGLEHAMRRVFQRYYQHEEPRGTLELERFLSDAVKPEEHYKELVRHGFHNVLLAQIFWPMVFGYSPFIVFLRNSRRHSLDGQGRLWQDDGEVDRLISLLTDKSEIVTNLGLIFGRAPKSENFDRFLRALRQLVEIYKKIEIGFIETVTRRMQI